MDVSFINRAFKVNANVEIDVRYNAKPILSIYGNAIVWVRMS